MTLTANEENLAAVERLDMRRVLVVDDDRDLADATADALREVGYATTTAYDFEGAVERTDEFAPDVAVLDVRLGAEDGVELIEALRERRPKILCILVTGHADTHSAVRALRSGAYDYLYKPVDIEMLGVVLDRCFDRLRIEEEKETAERALAESEARLRAIFDNTPVCMNLKDVEGRYILVNKPYEDWLGYPADEIVGKKMIDLRGNTERIEKLAAAEQAVLETGEVFEREVSVTREDGNVYDRILIKFPIKSADGSVSAIGTVALDNTERKQAERALAESEQRLVDAVESLPLGFILYDAEDRLVLRNSTMSEILPTLRDGQTQWTRYGDYLRRAVHEGWIPEAVGREDEWLRERAKQRRNPSPEGREMTFKDGRTLFAIERKTSDGGTVAVRLDITERKKAEEALRESEARFRAIIDNYPSLITLKDLDGRYLLVNESYANFRNTSIDDMIGKTAGDFETPDHAATVGEHDHEALERGGPVTYEREWFGSSGEVLPRAVTKFPAYDADGDLMGIGTISTDIAERKKAEEALRESEARFRALFDSLPLSVHIKDAEGRYVLANKAFEARTGRSSGEIKGKTPHDYFSDELVDDFAVGDKQVLADGRIIEREVELPNVGGELRNVISTKFPIFGADGKPNLVGSINTDITERKRAEEALRESQERISGIFDNSPSAITLKDFEGRYVLVNNRFKEWYDLTSDEVIGKTSHDIFPEEFADQYAAKDREVIESGVTNEIEYTAPFADGREHSLTVARFPVSNPDGQIIGVGSVSSDITDRKRAEENLQRSENRYRDLVEGSRQGIVIHKGWTPVFANQAYADLYGYDDPQELIAHGSIEQHFAPCELDRLSEYRAARLRGEPAPNVYEAEGVRRDGSKIWTENSVRVIEFDGAQAVQCTVVDLTERKRAEEALRKSEEQLRLVIDSLPVLIAYVDADETYKLINKCTAEWYGRNENDIVGKSIAEVHGPNYEYFRPIIQEVLSGKQVVYETRNTYPDGVTRDVYIIDVPDIGPDGNVRGFFGMSQDISERKRAEDALRENEALFRGAFSDASVAMALIDDNGRYIQVNSAFSEMVGYSADELSVLGPVAISHPDDQEDTVRTIEEWTSGGTKSVTHEKRYLTKSGDIVWAHVSAAMVELSKEGDRITIAQVQDITERKRAEQQLQMSEERFRSMFESSQVGMLVLDRNGQRKSANQAFCRLLGYTREEIEGTTVADFTHPEDAAESDSVYEEWSSGGHDHSRFEKRFLTKDGRAIWGEVNLSVLRLSRQQDFMAIAQILDITERKQAEEALRESEARLRGIIDHSPTGIVLKDTAGRYLILNKTFREWLNVGDEDCIGKTVHDFMPKDVADRITAHERLVMEDRVPEAQERQTTFPDGATRTNWTHKFPIYGPGRECTGVGTVIIDVTNQRNIEDQLFQAQKMEAVGQLTGGVAHDFNNLLTIVLANLELLSERITEDEQLHKLATTAVHAVRRGGELTQRLLAFSRQQPLKPQAVDLTELATGMIDLLRRTLGPEYFIEVTGSEGLWSCLADPAQIENAILNLAINARDAMPDGGAMTIETSNLRLSEKETAHLVEVEPGDYAVLSVTDIGSGMPPEIVERVFEPFFTTKETGKGSGLGLSMIYGFVQQSGGHMEIDSEPGQGTTVRICLPKAPAEMSVDQRAGPKLPDETASKEGSILVVEDDPIVRAAMKDLIDSMGYRVRVVANGPEAMAMLDEDEVVDLLFVDVMLGDQMTGVELAEMVRKSRPGIKLLFTSGHTEQELMKRGGFDWAVGDLLQKPFQKRELAGKLNAIFEVGGNAS